MSCQCPLNLWNSPSYTVAYFIFIAAPLCSVIICVQFFYVVCNGNCWWTCLPGHQQLALQDWYECFGGECQCTGKDKHWVKSFLAHWWKWREWLSTFTSVKRSISTPNAKFTKMFVQVYVVQYWFQHFCIEAVCCANIQYLIHVCAEKWAVFCVSPRFVFMSEWKSLWNIIYKIMAHQNSPLKLMTSSVNDNSFFRSGEYPNHSVTGKVLETSGF